MDSTKEDFQIPAGISSYLDTRVELIEEVFENGNSESTSDGDFTWTRLISRSPLWNSLETKLEFERLQKRAGEIKK